MIGSLPIGSNPIADGKQDWRCDSNNGAVNLSSDYQQLPLWYVAFRHFCWGRLGFSIFEYCGPILQLPQFNLLWLSTQLMSKNIRPRDCPQVRPLLRWLVAASRYFDGRYGAWWNKEATRSTRGGWSPSLGPKTPLQNIWEKAIRVGRDSTHDPTPQESTAWSPWRNRIS